MILISGCLSGNNPSYSGVIKINRRMRELVQRNEAIPICPELLGGLPAPRKRSEIAGGTGEDVLAGRCTVLCEDGKDITANFLKGAGAALLIAKKYNIKKAVLKSNSPSCGCGLIYDGTFRNKLIKGNGVTCALLKANGLEIMDEQTFLKGRET